MPEKTTINMWVYYLHWIVMALIVTADHFDRLEPAVSAFEEKIGMVEYESLDSSSVSISDTLNIQN